MKTYLTVATFCDEIQIDSQQLYYSSNVITRVAKTLCKLTPESINNNLNPHTMATDLQMMNGHSSEFYPLYLSGDLL